MEYHYSYSTPIFSYIQCWYFLHFLPQLTLTEVFATMLQNVFFGISLQTGYYLASKLVKKRNIGRENFFLLNVCGFCREKNSKNFGQAASRSLGSASTAVFRPRLIDKRSTFLEVL
jgi:hypothetical protein